MRVKDMVDVMAVMLGINGLVWILIAMNGLDTLLPRIVEK